MLRLTVTSLAFTKKAKAAIKQALFFQGICLIQLLVAIGLAGGVTGGVTGVFGDGFHTVLTDKKAFLDGSVGQRALPRTSSLRHWRLQRQQRYVGLDDAVIGFADARSDKARRLRPATCEVGFSRSPLSRNNQAQKEVRADGACKATTRFP